MLGASGVGPQTSPWWYRAGRSECSLSCLMWLLPYTVRCLRCDFFSIPKLHIKMHASLFFNRLHSLWNAHCKYFNISPHFVCEYQGMHFLALADNSPHSTLPPRNTFTQGSLLSCRTLARASSCKACPMDVALKVIYLFNVVHPAPCNIFSFIFPFWKRRTKMSSLPAKCNFCNSQISSLDSFGFFHLHVLQVASWTWRATAQRGRCRVLSSWLIKTAGAFCGVIAKGVFSLYLLLWNL